MLAIYTFFFYFQGYTAAENIASLLQALPFNALLWQVLGEAIQGTNKTPIQSETASLENNTSSPRHNSWMQSLLMAALEKEALSRTVPLCCHLLLYVRLLKRKLVTICSSAEQGRLQGAIQLCFHLLQYLLSQSVLLQQKVGEGETNGNDQIHSDEHGRFSYKPDKQGLDHVKDMCCTVLHHPVILNSFLWKPDQSLSRRISQDTGLELTYSVANLLLAVLPGLTWQQKETLMGPFVNKLCSDGMLEINAARDGTGNILDLIVKCSYSSVIIGLQTITVQLHICKRLGCCQTFFRPRICILKKQWLIYSRVYADFSIS